MRTRTLGLMIATLLAVGGFGIAQAEPGPNDHNNHGLCTAYFNGQKNGHDDGSPGPFAALEEAGREEAQSDGVDNDGDGQVDEDGEGQDLSAAEAAFQYCDGLIGGNPDHGRYDCSTDPNGETSCTENPPPNER